MEDTNESEVTEVKDDNADRAEEEASTYNTHSPGAHNDDAEMEDTNESEVTAVKDDNVDRAGEEKWTYSTHSPGTRNYDAQMEDTNGSEVTAVKNDSADRAEEDTSTYSTHSPGARNYDSGNYVAETWRWKHWEKMDFQLPLAAVGTLIGAGGETVQSIERLCRSSIRVDRESITDTGSITISVTGPSKAAVDWAKILSEAVTEHRVSGKQLYHMDANDEAAWDRLKRKPAELRQGRQKSVSEESGNILEEGDQLDNTDTQGKEDMYKPRSKNWTRCRRRRCTKAALRRKIASLRGKIKEMEEMWYYVRVQSPVTSAFFTSMASETQPHKGSTAGSRGVLAANARWISQSG